MGIITKVLDRGDIAEVYIDYYTPSLG